MNGWPLLKRVSPHTQAPGPSCPERRCAGQKTASERMPNGFHRADLLPSRGRSLGRQGFSVIPTKNSSDDDGYQLRRVHSAGDECLNGVNPVPSTPGECTLLYLSA